MVLFVCRNPSVSGFYKLLTSAMNICNVVDYFPVVECKVEIDGATHQEPMDTQDTQEEQMDILGQDGDGGAAASITHQLISKHQKKVS